MIHPARSADMLILPVDRIAELQPPFALKLVGQHRHLPIWLHVDRVWDFHALAGRCGHDCPVVYREDEDRFSCTCDGVEFRPDGRATHGRRRLTRFALLYREEVILIDLSRREDD